MVEKCKHDRLVVETKRYLKKRCDESFAGLAEYERDGGAWPFEQYYIKCTQCGDFINETKIKMV